MSEKKEIKEEMLEAVAGGEIRETWNEETECNYLYAIGYHVEIKTTNILVYQFTSSGIITAWGYRKVTGGYSPAYHIYCKNDPDDTGWYDERDLQDSTITSWTKLDASTVTLVRGEIKK